MNLKSYVRTAYSTVAGDDPLEPVDDSPGTFRFAVDPKTGGILALALALLCGLVVAWTASRPATVHAVPGSARVETSVAAAEPREPGRANDPAAGPAPGLSPEGRSTAASAGRPSGESSAPGAPTEIIVYVSGEVVSPGIVRLAEGARVVDAVDKAGGMTGAADMNALNLARVLVDGEHILVPRPGQQVVADEPAAGPLSINAASAKDLEELPGIGPSLATKIVEHREANGPFTSMDDLLEVKGIGEAKLAEIAEHAVP
ncbi:MAG: ComEA family DNA-binding protein [Flaviflexus sp.]|nr:ComEA family DNA-binding protein [Flaviflexus sp.]